jgi:nitric oxide reductase subunit B
MTATIRIAYSLFAQTIVLLMLYAAVALVGAVKFLAPDSLVSSLSYAQAGAFGNVLLNLAILTGLLGSGLYVVASTRLSRTLGDERLLLYTFWLWTLLLLLAFFAGILGLLEGRHLLELPPLLDIIQVIALALFIIAIVRSVADWSPVPLVWTLGLSLCVLCSLIGLIPTTDYVQDRVLRTLAVGLNFNVAYVLAGVALGFWLMRRFSRIAQQWADMGLYSVAGLLTLAGTLVTAASLYPFNTNSLTVLLGNIAVFAVPLAYIIFASHSYYALSNRNSTATLAAHWYALAVLLLLLSIGILGALQSAPTIQQWTLGTRLTDLQTTLTAFGIIAIIFGAINQATAEIRGLNQRITGLMPFWLVAFGLIGGGLALSAAGLVQVYLERILSIGFLETQTLLIPLYVFWILGTLAAALGILIYALGFWARRPLVR